MTDNGDKEILQMAEDIRNKQAKDEREVQENIEKEWFNSKIGKYYKVFFTGAHDEAFKAIFVRGKGSWNVETLEIMFAHIGHYSMGKGVLNYDEHTVWQFKEKYFEEIDEITYLGYVNKFLKLTGLKEKMDKETNH